MAQLLTVDELLAATEKTLALPALSKVLGEERYVTVRRIGGAEFLSLLPPDPPGAETWPEDPAERQVREREYLDALPPEAREARQAALRDVNAQVVALAAIQPTLTPAQARHLGADAMIIAHEILAFSGLLAPVPGAAAEST